MLHYPGPVGPGAPVRHLHPAPSLQGRKQDEQVARSVAFVFVIVRHGSPGLRREGLAGLLHQLFAGLVQAHQHLVSLAEGLDTGDDSPTSHLMLLSLAEWERETIRDHIRAGVDRAAAEGRTGGRPPALDSEKLRALRDFLENGGLVSAAARTFGVSRPTVRAVKDETYPDQNGSAL